MHDLIIQILVPKSTEVTETTDKKLYLSEKTIIAHYVSNPIVAVHVVVDN